MLNFLIIGVSLIFIFIAMMFAHRFYPEKPLEVGTEVNVYWNGRYNRTATITHDLPKEIVLYDCISFPVHYRGKFYAVGYTQDSQKLMYVGRRRLFILACIAEFIRKIVDTPEYDG
jgi:hypothetical protein